MLKYLKLENIKQFFKVRDENGDFDPDQAKASLIQIGLMLVFVAALVGLFLILWNVGVIRWIGGLL